jgi:hypothetical protein
LRRADLAPLIIEAVAGRQLGENGFYVPAPLLDAWVRLGGDEGRAFRSCGDAI